MREMTEGQRAAMAEMLEEQKARTAASQNRAQKQPAGTEVKNTGSADPRVAESYGRGGRPTADDPKRSSGSQGSGWMSGNNPR